MKGIVALLDEIALSAPVLLLVGENGSGTSTLLKAIAQRQRGNRT